MVEFVIERAIPNDYQSQARVEALHGFECINDQRQILFRGQTPHIEYDRLIPMYSPGVTKVGTELLWRKQFSVDTPFTDAKIGKALPLELNAQLLCRYYRTISTIMEFSQVAEDDMFDKTKMIVMAIAMKIGMKTGDDGYREAFSDAQG